MSTADGLCDEVSANELVLYFLLKEGTSSKPLVCMPHDVPQNDA